MRERFKKDKKEEIAEESENKKEVKKSKPKFKTFKNKYQELGIDLGNRNIKISLIDESHPKYVMDNRLYVVEENLDIKEYFKTVDLAINEFLKTFGIKRASLNFTVPCDNEHLITNVFTMNNIDETLIEDSIMYNIESLQPIKRRNFIHRYKVIDVNEETDEIKVISTLLNRDFKEKIKELKQYNWKIKKVIPQFYLGEKINQRESALIDFGYSGTRIYLYRDGKLVDLRTIPIGSRQFVENTKEIFETSVEEAEGIMRDGNLIKLFINESDGQLAINTREKSGDLIETLEELTKDIADRLKRTIRVMELNNNTIMNQFFYTGGITELNEFIDFLSKDIDSDMDPLTIYDIRGFRNIGYDKDGGFLDDEVFNGDIVPSYRFEEEREEPYIYSMLTPLGTARDFNYMDGVRFFIDRTALLIGLICATLVLNMGIFFINRQYNDKISQASKDLSILQDENSELDMELSELNSNIDRNETIIDRVENLKAKKKWLSDILYVLPGETPTNVGITNIEIEGRHAILTGHSEDYSSVGYLAMALEDYGDVTITEVGEGSGGDLKVENNVPMKKAFKLDIQYDDRLVEE